MNLWVLLSITLVFAALFPFLRNELVRRRLTCPETGARADVLVVQRHGESTRPVRVKACSRLPKSRPVDCDQACLRQLV